MCTYCGTINYRKIYENHHGEIPVDSDGRSFEVHHLDGNRKNNEPSNLVAVSIQEHYDIHYSQGDWAACLYISSRMEIDPVVSSELARKNAIKQYVDGTNPFFDSERISKHQKSLVEAGIHHLLDGEIQRLSYLKRVSDGTWHLDSETAKKYNRTRIEEGRHHLVGPSNNKRMILDGTHPSKTKVSCLICHQEVSKNGFDSHYESCKKKQNSLPVPKKSPKGRTIDIKTLVVCPCCGEMKRPSNLVKHERACRRRREVTRREV